MTMNEFLGLNHLLDYEFYLRGLVITVYSIFLFRTNSSRIFGEHSVLDLIISIILGAILGEAIVNKIPLIPSMLVCIMIVIIHRFLAYLSFKSSWIGRYIKGEKVILYNDKGYNFANLSCCRITENDVMQSLRVQKGITSIDYVKEAMLERSGEISFVMKDIK